VVSVHRSEMPFKSLLNSCMTHILS
jgi:hypothetical protein